VYISTSHTHVPVNESWVVASDPPVNWRAIVPDRDDVLRVGGENHHGGLKPLRRSARSTRPLAGRCSTVVLQGSSCTASSLVVSTVIHLFVPQGDRGLDLHGAASGDVACRQCDERQQH